MQTVIQMTLKYRFFLPKNSQKLISGWGFRLQISIALGICFLSIQLKRHIFEQKKFFLVQAFSLSKSWLRD